MKLNQITKKRYDDIEARKDQFNIFTAMFDESDEVNLHSQFIFSLLNFKTGNEYRYLNAFLKCIDSSFEYNLNSLEIHKELHDIDILLLDKSTKRAVIIENKIYASDCNHENEGQLDKYYRIIIEDEKITHYIKENLLAGSLCPKLYQKNPNFTNFINGHHLEFKTYDHFDKSSIEERCTLYSQIAHEFWTL